ncbi:RNA-binding cell elongation regulator Jag/EloR [Caldicellulosiruptoraceae bacterium PP1]
MKWVEKTGKTIDEAVEAALLDLNVERSKVEVEIIDEGSKGILGIFGSKPAKVKVIVKEDIKEIIGNFLTEVCSKMGVEISNMTFNEDDEYLKINIECRKAYIIIGKDGEVLDSLQYLAGVVAGKHKESNLKIILDCMNYRKSKEESLKRFALNMADKVVKSKRSIKLKPMTPYERRIIHTALQNHKFVTTYSEGEEPYRKVVISLK